MRALLYRWIAGCAALAVIAALHLGVWYRDLVTLALAVIVIGFVNATIRPVLRLLTLPLNCLTFGLFGFVLNALLFTLAGDAVPGFHVKPLPGAIIGPIAMSIAGGVAGFLIKDKDEETPPRDYR